MNSTAQIFGVERSPLPLRDGFLRWQCRVRQMAMRKKVGKPDDAVTPHVTAIGQVKSLGHIITVLSKSPPYDRTPELKHICKRTQDPAERREKAVQFFAEIYYQKAREFSDILTATFPPDSAGAQTLIKAGGCTLTFDAYGQRFDLFCTVEELSSGSPNFQATLWHNLLFNPNLHPKSMILAFAPDWSASSSVPDLSSPR